MTVEVTLHDFCGENCPFLKIEELPVARTIAGELVVGGLTCENYQLCKVVSERIKAQKGETKDG